MNKVAIYCTINKSQSKEDILKEYCTSKDYDYDIYVDTVKSKLDIVNRDNLNKLKDEVSNGKYKKLIIYGIDNISRDSMYNAELINYMYKNNCEIECVDGTVIDNDISKKINEFIKILNEKKEGKINMEEEKITNEEEREQRNSTNRFELEGNVGFIGDKFTNKNGKESLRFDLGQNNNGTTQFVPILLRGELVNTYGNEIKKGDWISVKGRISSYSKEVERDGKTFKEKVIDILGFEITDRSNNKVYSSNGEVHEIETTEEKER